MIAVPNYISPEEYLDIERQNPLRHEYRRGLVYAMSGGSDNHDRIAYNFLKIIDRSHRYIKRYPKLIAEILSPRTEAFDVGEKFEDYKQLETLQEYVLISQEKQWVECRRRTDTNTWETIVYQ
jgi:Uma2 family endonuclease